MTSGGAPGHPSLRGVGSSTSSSSLRPATASLPEGFANKGFEGDGGGGCGGGCGGGGVGVFRQGRVGKSATVDSSGETLEDRF